MRIGIDVSPITATRTGVGNYCYYLLKHLLALDAGCSFAGFSSGSAAVDLGPFMGRVSHRHLPVPTRALYALWGVLGWPKVDAMLGGVDVYHATNYYVPPVRTARRVVTIHDMAFLTAPELCSPKIRRVFSGRVKRFVDDADAVLACSESTKSELVRLVGADPAKIAVVYEAVDEDFVPVARDEAAEYLERHHGIRGPFLLFVSTLEPRKNVPRMLRAFARLMPDYPHTLVLVGGTGWNADEIFQTIDQLGLGSRVIRVGYVETHAELAAFYSAAAAFIFPSLCEGFGLGILEALTCGCPVVAARNSSMPEVGGDAAVYCEATDEDDILGAMRRVLDDRNLRETLASRGHEQARKFSWRRCAEETMAVYKSLGS